MDVKQAFDKVKQDINILSEELLFLHKDIDMMKQQIHDLFLLVKKPNSPTGASTLRQQMLDRPSPQENNSSKYEGIKPYFNSSTGNRGVSTLRQQTVNRQTDNKIGISDRFDTFFGIKKTDEKSSDISSFVKGLKKELKSRFKRLTKQEFYIFSLLYTLTEEKPNSVTYKDIALKAGISESSVRDYVSRLINKKIPIIKRRINNKSIILEIPRELKHLETLDSLASIQKYTKDF